MRVAGDKYNSQRDNAVKAMKQYFANKKIRVLK